MLLIELKRLDSFQVMNLKPHNRSDSTVGLARKGVHVRWGILFTLFAAPVVIIATAGLVLGITWTIREAQGRRAMQIALARLEDERIPTTCEGLAETYWEQTTDEFAETGMSCSMLLGHSNSQHRQRELPFSTIPSR